MFSLTRVLVSRTASTVIAPKAAVASGVFSRSFAIGSDLNSKRRVEEEKYIKSKEHEDYLKRKAAAAASAPELSAEELAAKRAHDAAVDEAFEILSRTGCKVKDETVEALAAWKLGKN